MNRSGKRLWLLGVAAVLGPGPLCAQAETDSDAEILVTALRRDMTILSAPAAVSAIDGVRLDNAGFRSVEDLQFGVPGLSSVRSGQSNTRLVIRGLQGVGEPLVGLYYDEIPMTGLVGASNDAGGSTPLLSLVDVERVEVLRGPQGVLYGAGAMTGAVRVLWRKPEDRLSLTAAHRLALAENGGVGWLGEATVNLPIAPGAAARIVAYGESRPSYVRNSFLGRDVDGTELWGARGSIRVAPLPGLELDLAGTYQKAEGDTPYWDLNRGRFEAFNRARLLNSDEIWTASVAGRYAGPGFDVVATYSHVGRSVAQGLNDVSEFFLGSVNNPAVCARLRGGGNPCTAAVQSAFNGYVLTFVPSLIYPIQESDLDAAELRLQSAAGSSVLWTAGAFFSERRGSLDNTGLRAEPVTGSLAMPLSYTFRRSVEEELRQLAAYGEVTVSPVESLDLTAGARAFRYERTVGGGTTQGLDLINAPVLAFQRAETDEDGVVVKANVAWRPAARTMIYLEASQGYRPGGANQVVNLPPELVPYGSDSLWNYELGLKSALFGGRLEVLANAFRIDWSRIQVSGSRPDGLFRFIANAGEARAEGVELELRAFPLEGLDVGGSLSLLDARLTQDQRTTLVVAPGRAGDRIPYSRELILNGDATYTREISGGRRLEFAFDAHHVGPSYTEFRPDNAFYRRLPPYTLVNARIGLAGGEGGWSIDARVDNLLDATAVQSMSASGLTAGRTLGITLPPRTWSVGVRVRY